MAEIICYTPQSIDHQIAEQLGWNAEKKIGNYPPMSIATLRGMYDTAHPNNTLDTSNAQEAAKTLSQYVAQLSGEHYQHLANMGSHIREDYTRLQDNLTAEERYNRVNMLSSMMSELVSRIVRATGRSRQEIYEGFIQNGRRVGGQFNLFERLFLQLACNEAAYNSMPNGEGREKALKTRQILDNWNALVTLTRAKLRDTEGIKLGNTDEFAAPADANNLDSVDLSNWYDATTSKRESWQETADMQSAYASIGENVRRVLGSIPLHEFAVNPDGSLSTQTTPVRDDLGYTIMVDPVRAHQELLEMLRSMTSESHMMQILKTRAKSEAWLNTLIQTLDNDPQVRTQFFVDLNKNFQSYSMIFQDMKNSSWDTKVFKTKLLNREEDLFTGAFNTRIALGLQGSDRSIYNNDGSINWQNLQKVREDITEWLKEPEQEAVGVFNNQKVYKGKQSKFYETYYSKGGKANLELRNFLVETSKAIGIDLTADRAAGLMKDSKLLRNYTKNLLSFLEQGIHTLTNETLRSMSNNTAISESKNYKEWLNEERGREGSKYNIMEKIKKMNRTLTISDVGRRLESRVLYKDGRGNNISLFSNVNPSYLGDKIKRIHSYVEANDKAGLRQYLQQEFLGSSFFVDNGKVLNKWIEELLKACEPGDTKLEDSFAGKFDYLRDLGSEEQAFENFPAKTHALDLLLRFHSDKQISSNADTALYPVFILGDSGVSKFIRAKRYMGDKGLQELQDGFYNVYKQEKRNAALAAASAQKLYELDVIKVKDNGDGSYSIIDGIENYHDNVIVTKESDGTFKFNPNFNKYTQLQFLNADFRAADGTIGKYNKLLGDSEETVKKAITTYMVDATKEFKSKLENLGLLETNDAGNYVYLSNIAHPSNIDNVLGNYYWNTKFATIQQLQMMTIDPSFYKGTKDLQKRYKEIHAPGTILSLMARDFDGNLYSEDGIERCLYFNDISTDTSVLNKEFFSALEYQFGELLKNGKITKAQHDMIIDGYKANTLTDGQGYRTLKSYRKVLGMAGKWTRQMEDVYNKIQEAKRLPPEQERKALSELSVVFQPIKPYMFTHEKIAINGQDCLYVPVQHKYAEAVLIPELLPEGSMLRDMAEYMEENNIDLVGSTKIVKVGAFGAATIDYKTNKNGEYIDAQGNVIEGGRKNKNFNYLAVPIQGKENLRDALSGGIVHQLSYADYRIQTNVPEHINSSQLFGTQLRKLIMAGTMQFDKAGNLIQKDYSRYVGGKQVNLGGNVGKVNLNGRNLIAFYNSLITANILQSYGRFESNVSNIETLSDRLIQNIIGNSRESLNNILAYSLDDSGNFGVPLFEGGFEHDSAAALFSIFKKMVNKQTIKGGSAVQVSAMGIKGYERDGGLKYVKSEDGKNILYAECEMPWDLSYVDAEGNTVSLAYDDYCNADGTLKMLADGSTSVLEDKFPGITSFIAYRIPTERAYSMINMKVVRFSRKEAGGTIKVPPEGTTIAGFDFDIDKLYFMRREYKAKKARRNDTQGRLENRLTSMFNTKGSLLEDMYEFEEYNTDLSPLENTTAARNNMLIELIQQRLMDEETFQQRYTPGGFAGASNAARILRELLYGDINGDGSNTFSIVKNGKVDFNELDRRAAIKSLDPEPNYDPSDPYTIITYNQQNQVAGKLIGIFANQNTNHAFASMMQKFILKNPIEFAGRTASKGFGYDMLHAPEGVDVDLNLAEFLAASVDAVKDPVLNFLNLNTVTADAGALLARLGYNTKEIGMLFNQPIIRELCEYVFNNNTTTDIAIRELTVKYLGKEGSLKEGSEEMYSIDQLAKNILNYRVKGNKSYDVARFKDGQMAVLKLVQQVLEAAEDVSQFVMSTKFTASNAVGSTWGDLYAQQMKVNAYLDRFTVDDKGKNSLKFEMVVRDFPAPSVKPVDNREDVLNMSDQQYMEYALWNPFAYEQAMYDMNRKVLRSLSKYYPYERDTYKNARDILSSLTKSGTLNANTINEIHRDLMVYLLARQERSDFNGNIPKNDTGHGPMTAREYYTQHFARDLFTYLENNPALKSLPIFQFAVFNSENGTNDVGVSIQGVGGLKKDQIEAIKDSWAELSVMQPEIARDLFLYNYYKYGFSFSPFAFMNLAPVQVKQRIRVPSEDNPNRTYVDFLNELMKDSASIIGKGNEFAVQYILNHLDNKAFVFKVRDNTEKLVTRLAFDAGKAKDRFELDLTSMSKEDRNLFILRNDKSTGFQGAYVRPVIQVGNGDNAVFYIANGGNGNTNTGIFNYTNNGVVQYVRMERLGTKGKSLQYITDLSQALKDNKVPEDSQDQGSTEREEGETTPPVQQNDAFDRNVLIERIAEVMTKAAENALLVDEETRQPYSKQDWINVFSNDKSATDQAIKDMANHIAEESKKDGVWTLDSEGKPTKVC